MDKGTWFDGSSIEGFRPHLRKRHVPGARSETPVQVLPWTRAERRIARVICDVHVPMVQLFDVSPRNILRFALEKARALGLTLFQRGAELESTFRRNGDTISPGAARRQRLL